MKFSQFKIFREILSDSSLRAVIDYLNGELSKTLRELQTGLARFSFSENFETFTITDLAIAAGAEAEIRNEFRNGVIPTKWIRVRGDTGSKDVVDGDTAWSANFVYLKNVGASAATLTVVFFRS